MARSKGDGGREGHANYLRQVQMTSWASLYHRRRKCVSGNKGVTCSILFFFTWDNFTSTSFSGPYDLDVDKLLWRVSEPQLKRVFFVCNLCVAGSHTSKKESYPNHLDITLIWLDLIQTVPTPRCSASHGHNPQKKKWQVIRVFSVYVKRWLHIVLIPHSHLSIPGEITPATYSLPLSCTHTICTHYYTTHTYRKYFAYIVHTYTPHPR